MPRDFDTFFSWLVKLTGWGLGVYVVVTGKLGPTETLGLIVAFIGFELVSRAKEAKLPELIKQKQDEESSSAD